MILEGGICQKCKEYEYKQDIFTCKRPLCNKREIIIPKATDINSCTKCADYLIADSNKENCIEPKCGLYSIILKDGSCQYCPIEQVPLIDI